MVKKKATKMAKRKLETLQDKEEEERRYVLSALTKLNILIIKILQSLESLFPKEARFCQKEFPETAPSIRDSLPTL